MITAEKQGDCVIAGGGPAGMMLGYLLARAGIAVHVLEKHADFFRDFRGDTVHPSTLQIMRELGLLEAFLACPHQKTYRLRGFIGDQEMTVADLSRLPGCCPYIAFMPQWDFLNFLAEQGKKLPNFHLHMQSKATDLLWQDGRVSGVRATTPDGEVAFRAHLTFATDGRDSHLRQAAELTVDNLGAPMDVFWFALPRNAGEPDESLGFFQPGHIVALINRQDYWQCGYVIPKGEAERWKIRPLEDFRREMAHTIPFLANTMGSLKSWDDVKLLTVTVDRLRQWYRPGFLCLGDAAHAMSPVGGVGINLAIQDAVAAANLLCGPLRKGCVTTKDLRRVQQRRLLPTRIIQRLQITIQNRIIRRVLASRSAFRQPFALRLLQRFPALAVIPAYMIGFGFRPEHVRMEGDH